MNNLVNKVATSMSPASHFYLGATAIHVNNSTKEGKFILVVETESLTLPFHNKYSLGEGAKVFTWLLFATLFRENMGNCW